MTLALALTTPHTFDGREEPEARVHGLEATRLSLLEMMQQSPMCRGRRRPHGLLDPGAEGRSEPREPAESCRLHIAFHSRHLACHEEPGTRLDLEPFSMLGGDPTSVDAPSLVSGITYPRIFVDCSPWHATIREKQEKCEPELVRRTQFSPDQLDDVRLRELRRVSRTIELVPLDAAVLRAALAQLSTDLLIETMFVSPEAFVSAGGFGFAVMRENQVLAAATSVIVSRGHMEIQVNTAEGHQRQGLATAAGAAIALESRARGLAPGWDTASPASEGLARKLGFRVDREYEWLCLAPYTGLRAAEPVARPRL